MLNDIKEFAAKNKYNLAIFLLYFVICIFTMFHHEIWRDEARVWVFLTDLDFKTLFDNIRFDGHPYLWYIVLFPFVKMGFSAFSMQVISVLFCSVAVLFFLVKSPFNYLIKILFVFSAGMIYFLPVIARNYALVPLFLFILAYLYPDRHNKPFQYLTVLILLSQTHCLIWGVFVICSLEFIVESIVKFVKEKNKTFIIIPFLLILYCIGMFFIYTDVFFKNNWNPKISTSFFSISIEDFHNLNDVISILYENDINIIVLKILFVLFIIMSIFLLKTSKRTVIFLITSVFYVLYVLLKVWYGGILYQKFFLIVLIIMFCYWISGYKKDLYNKISQGLLAVFLFLLFFNPLFINTVKDDIENTFTNTKEVSEFINKNDDILILINKEEGISYDNIVLYFKNRCVCMGLPAESEEKIIFNNKDIKFKKELPKYIVVSPAVTLSKELPYKEVLSAPKNRVSIYNTKEYYSVYEKVQ